MIAFRLEDWRAWAPGLETPEDWQAWAQSPHKVADDGMAQPACTFLPTMQRRRLSRLARMTMQTAWPLCGEGQQLPFVFGSHHGEMSRALALLSDITDGLPLSPTSFGLSVHNAIAGQWSALRGQCGESTAVAGDADTFEYAILEATLQLQTGAPAALVVVAEELPPAAYLPFIADAPFSFALALRLTRDGTPDWQLDISRSGGAAPCPWPHALDFLRALLMGDNAIQHTCKSRRWRWQRNRGVDAP